VAHIFCVATRKESAVLKNFEKNIVNIVLIHRYTQSNVLDFVPRNSLVLLYSSTQKGVADISCVVLHVVIVVARDEEPGLPLFVVCFDLKLAFWCELFNMGVSGLN
jgi:hypothetical protein